MRMVLTDVGTRCGTSTTRDWKTVSSRVEHEGFSFFTITLSSFGKDFEKSLDLGLVAPTSFRPFSRARGEAIPRFLGGVLELVFDRKTGRLLDEPSITAIQCVRQFSLMCAKIDLPCSETRTRKAMELFIECEKDVRAADASITGAMWEDFSRVGSLLWADLFCSLDQKIWADGVIPKHGPGSTADRLRGNAKWDQAEWTARLERVFPSWEYLLPSWHFESKLQAIHILEPREERPVRVISVPKTQKTPRIIALEPTCMQYVQQGILDVMMQEFRTSDNARNFVRFDSQSPNQAMAREGSLTGLLATLDLSEASDRVSYQHVRYLLRRHSVTRDAVDACRSRKAGVPGHGVIRLSKFASMGSALTFPFEALVFSTIVFVGIERALNRQLSRKDFKSFYGKVRVYGDDIIVPVDFVPSVISSLQDFGLVVNTGKSFWTGKFRESCGGDFYDGRDVTIARLKSELPTSRRQADRLISTVALRNGLFSRGYYAAVDYLDRVIEGIIPFPTVAREGTAVLGRLGFGAIQVTEVDPDLQIPLVKGMVIRSELPASRLDDSGALMKFFLKRGDEPIYSEDHLQFAGRARTVTLTPGMASPY